jgi:hypothetical protein
LPLLRRLLVRDQLIDSLRRGVLGFFSCQHSSTLFNRALVLLLAERGPSAELDATVARIQADPNERHRAANDELVVWARERTSAG